MITLKPLFITATAGLLLLFPGCTNAPATVQAPTIQKVSIISDPPGARIEINNDYVGDAPLELDLPIQFGGRAYTITATPRETGYVQTNQVYRTLGCYPVASAFPNEPSHCKQRVTLRVIDDLGAQAQRRAVQRSST